MVKSLIDFAHSIENGRVKLESLVYLDHLHFLCEIFVYNAVINKIIRKMSLEHVSKFCCGMNIKSWIQSPSIFELNMTMFQNQLFSKIGSWFYLNQTSKNNNESLHFISLSHEL